jgi:two-component system, chemotaxis family, chemotaxis protein CheY
MWQNDMNTSIPVLVVDDSHTISVIISNFLRKLGFIDVDLAQDGQSALDRLHNKQYGLVLSDWEMQPMNGDQFLKELRQDSNFSRIPIILITGKSSRGVSWLAGASAYLAKPFSEGDFAIAIQTALKKS